MLFGIPIWPILLVFIVIMLIKKRGDLVANLGDMQYQKRDYPKALHFYRLAEKVGPLSLKHRMLLGYVYLRCGRVEEAGKYLRLCLAAIPRNGAPKNVLPRNEIRNLLALVSWKEGNMEDGIDILESLLEEGYRTTVVYQNLGIFYNLKEDRGKALQFALEAYDYNADDPIIVDNLAEAYAQSGDNEKALEVYEELIRQEPEPRFPEAYYGYGETLIRVGRREEGLAMLQKALTKPFSFLSVRPKEDIEALYQHYTEE